MPPYLTPGRFRTMDFGVNTSMLSDGEMLSLATQATTWVNAYCLAPRLPQPHDFRGGTAIGEQHSWRYPETPFDIGQRRAHPMHWPITSVDLFRIYVTNTQYVGIAPSELFINQTAKYVEVVSLALTSAGLFNALIIPNVGLATPTLTMDYSYGRTHREVGDYLMPSDGQTYRAQNQWWYSDVDHAPVIYVNGVVTIAGFTIDYNEGTVRFAADLTAEDIVTADYYYKLPNEIQWATGHIMTWLHTEAEQHARGIAHLSSLAIDEVKMTRVPQAVRYEQVSAEMDKLIPEAAALLYTYRFDNVSVR